jgi:hypothetical protein
MDYYPSDEQLKAISKYLPTNCDYFCTSCEDNCKSCPNGLLPIDNRCKANYINEDPLLNSKQELFEVPLNEALDGNLVSDAYGYTQWFYVENINKNEENVLSVEETVKLDNNNHNSVIEPSAYIVLSPNNGTN